MRNLKKFRFGLGFNNDKKALLFGLVIAAAGLMGSQTAQAEDRSISYSLNENSALAATPDTANSKSEEQAKQPIAEFSKGYQKWQAYGSLACCDDGKGEMYAFHIGYGYFFLDDFSVNVDVLGSYIRSDIDDDGAAIGLDLIFRRHQYKSPDNQWSLFVEAGSGLQKQSTNYAGNRTFNFRLLAGGGATVRIAEKARLMGGMRYLHISDAGIEGGGGGFDGFQFYAGSMFPF